MKKENLTPGVEGGKEERVEVEGGVERGPTPEEILKNGHQQINDLVDGNIADEENAADGISEDKIYKKASQGINLYRQDLVKCIKEEADLYNLAIETLKNLDDQLIELRAQAKKEEGKKDGGKIIEVEAKIRETENNIKDLKEKIPHYQEIREIREEIIKTRETIKGFEKKQDEEGTLKNEAELRALETRLKTLRDKLGLGDLDVSEELESQELESQELEIAEDASNQEGKIITIDHVEEEAESYNLAIETLKNLDDQLIELRAQAKKEEGKKDGGKIIEVEAKIRETENNIKDLKEKIPHYQEIREIREEIIKTRETIKGFEKKQDEEGTLKNEAELRALETRLKTLRDKLGLGDLDVSEELESQELESQELEIAEDASNQEGKIITIDHVEEEAESYNLAIETLKNLDDQLIELRAQAKKEEGKKDGGKIIEVEAKIRETENNIKDLKEKIPHYQEIREIREEIIKTRETIKGFEKKQDEEGTLKNEAELRALETRLKTLRDKLALEDLDVSEELESERPETVKDEEDIKISPRALKLFSEFNISQKDLAEIPNFKNLSEAAQILLAQTFSRNALEIAQAKAAQEKNKRVTSKWKPLAFLQRIKINLYNGAGIDREIVKKVKTLGLKIHREELTNLARLYTEVDLKGELKDKSGEKELEIQFVDKKDYNLENLSLEDGERVEELISNFNLVADKLVRMPKYWQQEFINNIHNEEYQEALANYQTAKAELATALSSLTSTTRVAKTLNDLEYKVNMVQFLTANPDLEKDWKNMNKKAIKRFLTNFSKAENLSYMGAGFASRIAITSVIGYVGVPLMVAAIGAARGHDRGEKMVEEQDKNRARSNHIKDSNLFAQKNKVFQDIVQLNRDNKEPNSDQTKIEKIVDKCIEDPKFIAKAKEIEGFSGNKDDEFIPNRDVNYVQQVYKNLDKHNNLSDEESKFLQIYSDKVSELKALNAQINEQQDKAIDKNVERATDLKTKLVLLVDKIKSDNSDNARLVGQSQAEYQKNLDMLARRVDYSRDRADRDLINFGGLKERAINQADFYKVLSEASLLLIENKHNTESNVYQEAEDRAKKFISYVEENEGIKLSKNRKKLFIRKAVEGATMGVVFYAAGYAATSAAMAAYEGVHDSVSNTIADYFNPKGDLSGSENLIAGQASLEADDVVSEIMNNQNLPFKDAILDNPKLLGAYDELKDFTEEILKSVVKAGEVTENHSYIFGLVQKFGLNPEEQIILLEMPNASPADLIEQVGELRSITSIIKEGGNFTQSLREILNNAPEDTQDAFIARVDGEYGILGEGGGVSDANREAMLNSAINRLSVEGADPDSGVVNIMHEGNVVSVNSTTGQWGVGQGESPFAPEAGELSQAPLARPAMEPLSKIDPLPAQELSPRSAPVPDSAPVGVYGEELASSVKPEPSGTDVLPEQEAPTAEPLSQVREGEYGEVIDDIPPSQEDVLDGLKNEDANNMGYYRAAHENAANTEGAGVTNMPKSSVENQTVSGGGGLFVEETTKGQSEYIQKFLAGLSEAERANLGADELKKLFEGYTEDLNPAEQVAADESFRGMVTESINQTLDSAVIRSNSVNLANMIYQAKDILNPEKVFIINGEETSFSAQLNNVSGVDKLYDSLSQLDKQKFEDIIQAIHDKPMYRSQIHSKPLSNFVMEVVKKYGQ